MSDALPLPPRPNLEQYKKVTKDTPTSSACCWNAARPSTPKIIAMTARPWAGPCTPGALLGTGMSAGLLRSGRAAGPRGAKLDPQWYEANVDRQRAAKKMQSDPRMRAATPWPGAPYVIWQG